MATAVRWSVGLVLAAGMLLLASCGGDSTGSGYVSPGPPYGCQPVSGSFTPLTATVTSGSVILTAAYYGTVTPGYTSPVFSVPLQISVDGGTTSSPTMTFEPVASTPAAAGEPTGTGTPSGPSWSGEARVTLPSLTNGTHTLVASMPAIIDFSGVLALSLSQPFGIGSASASLPTQATFAPASATASGTASSLSVALTWPAVVSAGSTTFSLVCTPVVGTTTEPTTTVAFVPGTSSTTSASLGTPVTGSGSFTLNAVAAGTSTLQVQPPVLTGFSGMPPITFNALLAISAAIPPPSGMPIVGAFAPLQLQPGLVQVASGHDTLELTAWGSAYTGSSVSGGTLQSFSLTVGVLVDASPAGTLIVTYTPSAPDSATGAGAITINLPPTGTHAVLLTPVAPTAFSGLLPPAVALTVETQGLLTTN